MDLFVWETWYNTGIEEVDTQHRQLVYYLNSLYRGMKSGKGFDVMNEILNGLTKYTVIHFHTEEELMKKYKYPDIEKHKNEHIRLIEEVKAFKCDFEIKKRTLSFDVAEYLKSWLKNHILGTDKQMGKFLVEKMK